MKTEGKSYEEKKIEIRKNGQPYDEYDGNFYTEDALDKLELLALAEGERRAEERIYRQIMSDGEVYFISEEKKNKLLTLIRNKEVK